MASGKVKCEQLCRLNGSLMTNGEVEAGHLQIDGQNMGGKIKAQKVESADLHSEFCAKWYGDEMHRGSQSGEEGGFRQRFSPETRAKLTRDR